MKQFIFLVTLLMQVAINVSGQSTDEKGVRKIIDELASAYKKQDVAELDRKFAMDYTFVNSSGVLFNKSERLADIKSAKPWEYFGFEDKKIRFYGNTAIVNSTVKMMRAGQDTTQAKSIMVMVKNNGRWQVVAGQGTPITAKQIGQKLN
jgi:ketosteroid isomerase-like protein